MSDDQGGVSRPVPPLKRWVQPGVLVAALVCAVIAPRALTLTGLELTAPLEFPDAICHLYNVDLLHKVAGARAADQRDPFLAEHPEQSTPQNPAALAPALYTVAQLWVGWFGPLGLWTTQLTNLLFLLAMLVGVIGLGRELLSPRLGLVAALLTALCPALVASSWYFSSDFPLAACTTLGLWLLAATRGFTRPWPAAALAAWSVVGCLVKMTYALYMLFPALGVLALALLKTPARLRVAAISCATLLLWGAALVVLRGDGLERDLSTLLMHLGPGAVEPDLGDFEVVSPWSIRGVLSVPAFAAMDMPLPLLLLALPGLVALHRRLSLGGRWLPVLFIWGVTLTATLFPHRQARYILPLYPVLCLAAAWWIEASLPRRWRDKAAVGLVSAFASVLILTHFHPTPWWLDTKIWPTTGLLSMPGSQRLGRLRATPGEPALSCEYSSVVRAIQELGAEEGTKHILGVAGALPPPGDLELTALLAAHRMPHRLVKPFHLEHLDAADLPVALVVLHDPGHQPEETLPSRRTRRVVQVRLKCGEQQRDLAASLLLPRPRQ